VLGALRIMLIGAAAAACTWGLGRLLGGNFGA